MPKLATPILIHRKPNFASPPILLVHGLQATGKTLTIRCVLASLSIPSAVASSKECITTRHLLERTLATVMNSLHAQTRGTPINFDGKCDSISAFVIQLQCLLEGKGKYILVFDGIDRQREASPTLLPAIARLGEIVRLTMHSLWTRLTLYRYRTLPSSWS